MSTMPEEPGEERDLSFLRAGEALVRAGQRSISDALCGRCQSGQLTEHKVPRGVERDIRVYCHHLRRHMPPDIIGCSYFQDAKAMSLYDMERIAVLVDTRKAGEDGAYL